MRNEVFGFSSIKVFVVSLLLSWSVLGSLREDEIIGVFNVPELIVLSDVSSGLHSVVIMVDGEGVSISGKELVLGSIIESSLVSRSTSGGKVKSAISIRPVDSEVWVGCVMERSGSNIPIPKLLWLIDNLVLNSENLSSSLVSGAENLIHAFVRSSGRVEIESFSWLHGGGVWLIVVVSSWGLWVSGALNNLNIENDVRVERNWLTTEWGKGVSTSPGVV